MTSDQPLKIRLMPTNKPITHNPATGHRCQIMIPKSKGDEPMKNRPSPVWSTNAYRRDDPEETLEDQDKGDQQREDDGGSPRIGEDQESAHDVENTGQQIEEKAAPAPFLRAGMDGAGG